MSESSVNDKLESYAYHEAGHAVLALASSINIPRMSILSQDYCCEVEEIDFLRGAGMDMELGLLRYFCFLIAGKEAERQYLYEQNSKVDESILAETAGVDYGLINEKVKFLKQIGNPLKVDIPSLSQQVNMYLNRPSVWNSVQDLASRLLNFNELNELQPTDYPISPFTPTLHS